MDPSLLGRPITPPVAQKPRGLLTARAWMILGAMVAAILAGIFLLFGSQDQSGTLQQRVSARQTTTLKLVADGQKNLKDADLSKLNSELSIVLAGDDSAVQAALKNAGMKKIDKEITAAEADEDTFKSLSTAKISGRYDTAYQDTLVQKLDSLRALLAELHGATRNKPLKAVLDTEYQHLGGYLKTLQTTAN
jgi:hypothetical protein